MKFKSISIGVIGGKSASEETLTFAYEVGKHIAQNALLICGGLGGVMEAASKGAAEHGGTVVGILPGSQKNDANPFVHIALPTGMGVGRNVLVVQASDVLIAFPGCYGTLSEIALALNNGKAVIHTPGTWNITKIGQVNTSLFKEAFDPARAVGLALNALNQ